LPKLYEPIVPINVADLSQEYERPWANVPSQTAGPTFRVVCSPPAGQAQTFPSVAAACAAAPANQETVVEIDANGPLFEEPITVSGRSLVVRAGKGYRPLLAWDAKQGPAGKGEQFISLSGGRLTLENLDVVFQATARGQTDSAALLRITDGDLIAKSCTFSVAGKHSAGVAVVRLDGAGAATPPKCRLNQCYLRGAEVIGVDVRVTGAEVLLDGCLVAGAERPLIDVRGPNSVTPATVRVRRSTLVAGRSLLRLMPATANGMGPSIRFLGWDTLLARSGSQNEHGMFVLPERSNLNDVEWQATNCLYAGWRTLVNGPNQTITAIEMLRNQFHHSDGDAMTSRPWPPVARAQPAEVAAANYRVAGSEVCFAATSGTGPLGCDLAALPPTRDDWLRLTYEQFIPAAVDLPKLGVPPPIPVQGDNRYHGEQLNLAQVSDLGQYLRDIQKSRALAPRVVLHLVGTGEHRTSPIVWKGSSLVLYFQPAGEEAEPLTLVPNGATAADHEALIDIADGNLEIVGGTIRFADRKLALLPAYMLRVRGGDLSLVGCRLEGPLAQPPDSYRGLVDFEAAGDKAERTHACGLADSVLISGRTLLRMANPGWRLRIENCVLLANGNALELDPGDTDRSRLDVQGSLRRNTVAVKGAVVHLKNAPRVQTLVEPMLIQAKANVFMDPFTGPTSQSGLLRYEANALDRGLLIWQGQGNLYDKRWHFYVHPETERLPEKPQSYTIWSHLWGTAGETQPVADVGLPHLLAIDKPPQLGQLALPPLFKKPLPGADLSRLGLTKKRAK
jgi:hypothetical protein